MYIRHLLAVALLFCGSAAQADITSNLQGWWKLDEGSGTSAADSSGNSNTGTLVNTPTWGNAKIGASALQFAVASSQSVTCGTSSTLKPTGALTLAAWIYTPTTLTNNVNYTIVQTGSIGSTGYAILARGVASGDANVNLWINGTVTSATAVLPTSTWKHVCTTWDGSSTKVYINGTSVKTGSVASITYGAETVYIARNNIAPDFNGTIDDVRIYSRALSGSDVTQLYNYPPKSGALWFYHLSRNALEHAILAQTNSPLSILTER